MAQKKRNRYDLLLQVDNLLKTELDSKKTFFKDLDKIKDENISNFDLSKEQMLYIDSMSNITKSKLVFGTKNSMIKLVDGCEFDVSRKTIAATKLNEDDELIFVNPVIEGDSLVMQSQKDMFLRIDAITIPEKKKTAVGVRGMKLAKGDLLSNYYVVKEAESNVEIQVNNKTISISRLHLGSRDTKGVKK